jgi:hypothetical protein
VSATTRIYKFGRDLAARAAADIQPVSRMLSSSLALPGPIRAPDSKTMLRGCCSIASIGRSPGLSSRPRRAGPAGGVASSTPIGAEVLERYNGILDRAATNAVDDLAALARALARTRGRRSKSLAMVRMP